MQQVLVSGSAGFIGGYVVFSGEPAASPSARVQPEPVPTAKVESVPAAGVEPAPVARPEPAAEAKVESAPAAKPEPAPAAKPEPASPAELAPAAKPGPASTAELAPAAAAKLEPAPAAKPEPAPAAKPEPAPVAAPSSPNSLATRSGGEPSSPAAPTASAPMLVDVRIDSTPSGATVTLVDRGKSQFVGKTPVSATLDASREYDLVFSFPSKATLQQHLNASTTRHVAVKLAEPANLPPAPAPAPVVAAPPRIEKPAVEKAPTGPVRRASAEPAPAPPARKPGKAAAEAVAGEGTLMVSSKPPCQIVVDGKPTGLTTPQRSIALPAGSHKITLINSEKDIKKTISVQITANGTEKIIEDLMQ